MCTEKIETIRKLLKETSEIANTPLVEAHNYASVKQRVLQLELQSELDYLTQLIEEPPLFEERFKQRCQERFIHEKEHIGFRQEPLSATNGLYWNIAQIYFEPKSMQEMLAILLPNVKKQLTVNLSEDYQGKYKEAFNQGLKPIVNTQTLDSLQEKPDHAELAHFVLYEDLLLDTRDLAHFPLGSHCQFREQLLNPTTPVRSNKPTSQLLNPLYQHNNDLRVLQEDMSIFENKGITPKKALEQLIQGLLLGGERMTGSEMASTSAEVALARFMRYLKSLPEQVQHDLKQSKGQTCSLGDVIEKELEKGTCVETAALHLGEITQACQNNPLWNNPVAISPKGLKQLQDKYRKPTGLRTLKEESTLFMLPEQFIEKAIQHIEPKNHFEFISLIMDFPPQWYALLLKCIRLQEPDKALEELVQCIRQGFFSLEQRHELGNAVMSSCYHLYPNAPLVNLMEWARKVDESFYLKALEFIGNHVQSLPENQRLQSVKTTNSYGETILHLITKYPRLLKIILELLPEENRLEVLTIKMKPRFASNTVLHSASEYLESLQTIIELLPMDKRLEAVKFGNDFGVTVMDCVAENPLSLQTILKLLPEDKRVEALKPVNQFGQTVLVRVGCNSESLKVILDLLPKKDLFELIKFTNQTKYTVLHEAAENPLSLKTILGFLPENQCMEAVRIANIFGDTVLHLVAEKHQALQTILECLPEDRRLEALMLTNKTGKTVLDLAKKNPASLSVINEFMLNHKKSENEHTHTNQNTFFSFNPQTSTHTGGMALQNSFK